MKERWYEVTSNVVFAAGLVVYMYLYFEVSIKRPTVFCPRVFSSRGPPLNVVVTLFLFDFTVVITAIPAFEDTSEILETRTMYGTGEGSNAV